MARRLADESRFLGPARICGRLYRIYTPDSFAYPGLVPDETGAPLIGDLLALTDPAATLDWLDTYEEAGPAFPEPQEYRRVLLPVTTDKETRRAWVYIYCWQVEETMQISSGDWLSRA